MTITQRRRRARPSYPSAAKQWSGIFLTGFTILCLHVIALNSDAIKSPGGILWIVLMFVSYWSGLRTGMISTALSLLYLVFAYQTKGTHFVYTHAMHARLVSAAIVFPLFTLLVGGIQGRLRNAAIREYDAREAAEAEATGRRETEEDRERLAAIVESSSDAIIGQSLDGTILSWNSGAERMFDLSRDEVLGGKDPLVPANRVPELSAVLERIQRGEGASHLETVRLGKDGAPIDVSMTISPIHDRSGNVTGISQVARDITEKKQSEARLQAQLGRLNLLHRITRAIGEGQDLQTIFQVVIRTLEDHMPIDICCVCSYDRIDHALTVSSVGARSEALARELGLTEQAIIPIDENGLYRCVRGNLVYEPDITQSGFPFPARLAKGGLKSFVAAPLLVESQVFGVLVCARRDAEGFSSGDCEFLLHLSEQVALAVHQTELYGALQHAYDDLRQTQQAIMQQERLRALGQMASGIAHDINNAISPIMLYTEALLESEPNLSDRARGYLEITARAIDDVAATVARMREFYRERESQSNLSTVHVNRLVQEVIDLTRARWSDMALQAGVVFDIQQDLQGDLPAVLGIESELREALTNLVLNAVDAMPTGGTLKVRTYVDPYGLVRLEVTDEGIGMDETTRRRCLEPFFTTKGERGTGLGLAMVYGVVKRHGADIEIDSRLQKGTTVRIVFPSAIDGSAAEEVQTKLPAMPRTRILIVDDDPMILKSLGDTLEADGHSVVLANGGQAGIDAFRAATEQGADFPVVITDLGMPSVDGRKVASAVKELSANTQVILLTGWGQRLLAEGDIPPHVDRVISKPPRVRDLREALAQSLAEAA